MKWIKGDTKVPIANWAVNIEEGALKQARNLANLDFVVDHVSLMPDCHFGKGMPIGGVIACKDVIIPNAVGVDIGCGVGFLELNIPVSEIRNAQEVHGDTLIKTILKTIKKVIPTGFAHHTKPQQSFILDHPIDDIMEIEVVANEINKAKFQIGTLGSGNHFLELQINEAGNLCIMLHSGSRNFGYKIANHFNKLAQAMGGMKYKGDSGLAHLDVNSTFGKQYIKAMNFALEFAKENREIMMRRALNVTLNLIKKHIPDIGNFDIVSEANIHHNYAVLEEHYGQSVWVHRKGAICMLKGDTGIISGSMGAKSASYIVSGTGNKESFHSASHGAGRIMGRMAFNKQFSLKQAEKSMEGVEFLGWGKTRKGKLDYSEVSEAYKDIEVVMNAQKDLVDIKMKLKPIGSLKDS